MTTEIAKQHILGLLKTSEDASTIKALAEAYETLQHCDRNDQYFEWQTDNAPLSMLEKLRDIARNEEFDDRIEDNQ